MPISITNFVTALVADALCHAAEGKVKDAEAAIGDAEHSVYLVVDGLTRQQLIIGIDMAKKQVEIAKTAVPAAKVPFYQVRVVSVNQGE